MLVYNSKSKIAENVVFSEEGDLKPMYKKYEFEIPNLENGDEEVLVLDLAVSGEGTVSATESVSDESATSSAYMTTFPKSGFENLPENATLMDRLAYGGKITLIGMITVFLVLIIIWALCAVMGKIFGGAGKKENDSQKKAQENAPAGNAPAVQTAVQKPVVPSVSNDMVAVVASAAIAAYRGEDTVNFNISSIRPCGNGAVALAPEVVAQIAASIACLEGKDTVDFTISSIRII
jgi:Na+-transporting methylmalonyl-CoA/oxaloacetate decarboxylase gamma subunit